MRKIPEFSLYRQHGRDTTPLYRALAIISIVILIVLGVIGFINHQKAKNAGPKIDEAVAMCAKNADGKRPVINFLESNETQLQSQWDTNRANSPLVAAENLGFPNNRNNIEITCAQIQGSESQRIDGMKMRLAATNKTMEKVRLFGEAQAAINTLKKYAQTVPQNTYNAAHSALNGIPLALAQINKAELQLIGAISRGNSEQIFGQADANQIRSAKNNSESYLQLKDFTKNLPDWREKICTSGNVNTVDMSITDSDITNACAQILAAISRVDDAKTFLHDGQWDKANEELAAIKASTSKAYALASTPTPTPTPVPPTNTPVPVPTSTTAPYQIEIPSSSGSSSSSGDDFFGGMSGPAEQPTPDTSGSGDDFFGDMSGPAEQPTPEQ